MKRSAIAAAALAAALAGCAKPDILIGFAGSVSGKDYALGVEARNAAELFVRRLNDRGGIDGRRIALSVADFASDYAKVAPLDRGLVDAGAVVILGHLTSSAAELGIPVGNEARTILVSPSATSASLGGKDDCFIRVVMSSARDPEALVAHMKGRGLGRVFAIVSSGNKSYNDTYIPFVRDSMELVGTVEYGSLEEIDYAAIAAMEPFDAVLIVATSIDSGTIAQKLAISGIRKPLYLSGWAASSDLLEYGGAAVEGAVFVHQVDMPRAQLSGFPELYESAYGEAPGIIAIETWDAMRFIETVLRSGGTDRASFYRVAKSLRSFEGSMGTIELDANGDARRTLFLNEVRNGVIVVVGTFD